MRNLLLTILFGTIFLAGCGLQSREAKPPIRYGTHEVFGSQNLPQNFVSHADVTLGAGGSPTLLLSANVNRIDAPCFNKGANDAVIGDSTIGASAGTPLKAGTGATPEATSALYGYSASGTTINCGEEVRP
jgi:hypothetical protein